MVFPESVFRIPSFVFYGVMAAFVFGAPSVGAAGFLFEPRLSFSSDAQAGVRFGLRDYSDLIPGDGSIETYLDFDGRLLRHSVRERVSPTFSYQYREARWGAGAGVSHVHRLASVDFGHTWGLVSGAGVGWSFADYKGTARAPETGWTGWGELGVRYDAGDAWWTIGLQVKPLPSVFPVRLQLQTGWGF